MATPTVVITGASSGIGATTARALAAQGMNVVVVGRSPERAAQVAAEIGTEPLIADFAHFDQVRTLADTLLDRCSRIDVLINNASALVPTRQVTADGHELTFQTNHLAPFLLTTLLLPRLQDNARRRPVRVITTSSSDNRFGTIRLDDLEWEKRPYDNGHLTYSTTKLMNIVFTRELAHRTTGTGIASVGFHPRPGRTDDNPAEPLIWLATDPEIANASGSCFSGFTKDVTVNPQTNDPPLAAQLWGLSTIMVRAYAKPRRRPPRRAVRPPATALAW